MKEAFLELKKDNELSGIVLDLRNNGGGLLQEAVNITNIFVPKGEHVVSTKGKLPSKNQPILVYCTKGGRGLLAGKLLQEMGYSNVRNIKGGIKAWMKVKLPLEK